MASYRPAVLLIPLVSWAAPANRGDALFLYPSVQRCVRRFHWAPQWTVGDKAYINLQVQRKLREQLQVSLITRLRSDMRWVEPYDTEGLEGIPCCAQGQPLQWLGFDEASQEQWFGVGPTTNPLCNSCWRSPQCPREFSYPAAHHEILLGRIPQASFLAKHLREKVRPWIEPAQSYEKNQLGLSAHFLNSLHLAWVMFLLADTVTLLRAHALLRDPVQPLLLRELTPTQLAFPWG